MRKPVVLVFLGLFLGSACMAGTVLDINTTKAISGGCYLCVYGRSCQDKWCNFKTNPDGLCTTCDSNAEDDFCKGTKDSRATCDDRPSIPGCGKKIYTGRCQPDYSCFANQEDPSNDDCPQSQKFGRRCGE